MAPNRRILDEQYALSLKHDAEMRRQRRNPVTLSDTDCWRQTECPESEYYCRQYDLGWHREHGPEQRQPTHCGDCGSASLTWDGDAWWCNDCSERADRDDTLDFDIRLPTGRILQSNDEAFFDEAMAGWRYYRGRPKTKYRRLDEGKP